MTDEPLEPTDVTDVDVMGGIIQHQLASYFLNTNRKTAKDGEPSVIELEWSRNEAGGRGERWYRTIVQVSAAEDITEELAMLEEDWADRERELNDWDWISDEA